MAAPEKLYLSENIYNTFVYQVPDDDDKTQVEYVRKDTFIKKACESFCMIRCKGNPPRSTCTSLGTCDEHDDFRRSFIKGE